MPNFFEIFFWLTDFRSDFIAWQIFDQILKISLDFSNFNLFRERSSRKPKAAQSGQVVIERRSREKRVEKNLHSDSSEEDATKMKKSQLKNYKV